MEAGSAAVGRSGPKASCLCHRCGLKGKLGGRAGARDAASSGFGCRAHSGTAAEPVLSVAASHFANGRASFAPRLPPTMPALRGV